MYHQRMSGAETFSSGGAPPGGGCFGSLAGPQSFFRAGKVCRQSFFHWRARKVSFVPAKFLSCRNSK